MEERKRENAHLNGQHMLEHNNMSVLFIPFRHVLVLLVIIPDGLSCICSIVGLVVCTFFGVITGSVLAGPGMSPSETRRFAAMS